MKNKSISILIPDFLYRRMCGIMLFLSIGITSSLFGQSGNLTVITNEKGAPTQLKFSELRSILMGEKQRWKSGSKIVIALMKTNTATGTLTSQKIYDMSGDELKKFWLALVFGGKADAPTFFNSAQELESYVASNPGAIGIIDDASPVTEAHVILIDGKKSI